MLKRQCLMDREYDAWPVRRSIRFVQIEVGRCSRRQPCGSELNMQPPAVDTWIQQQSQPTGPRQAHHCAADHTCAPAQSFPDAGSNCAVRRRRDTAPYSPTVPTVEFRIHPPPLSLAVACVHASTAPPTVVGPQSIYLSIYLFRSPRSAFA
jgi:hypothetical protein